MSHACCQQNVSCLECTEDCLLGKGRTGKVSKVARPKAACEPSSLARSIFAASRTCDAAICGCCMRKGLTGKVSWVPRPTAAWEPSFLARSSLCSSLTPPTLWLPGPFGSSSSGVRRKCMCRCRAASLHADTMTHMAALSRLDSCHSTLNGLLLMKGRHGVAQSLYEPHIA